MRENETVHWTLNYPSEKDPRPARILALAATFLPDDVLDYFNTHKILFSAETDLCKGGGILCLSKKLFKEYTYIFTPRRVFLEIGG